jgi:cobalt-zinc-cadmium efflux system membrane fusion protein
MNLCTPFLKLLLVPLLLVLGQDAVIADSDEEHGEEERSSLIQLTDTERQEFRIEVAEAGPGTVESVLSLPAEVRPNADRLAHIVPRYPGVVTEVRAHIGDRVEAGQVLAILESDESLASFELKTLISGTVIEKSITLGEAIDDRDVFVIADLSTVWIDITIFQHDIEDVRVGQRVELSTTSGRTHAQGAINYVTPIVDETTRTGTARVVLENRGGAWRPGAFVIAKVIVGSTEVPVAVPHTALHVLDQQTVVFVATEDGFRPTPVVVGREGTRAVELTSGLSPGEHYVRDGGFTLKAELGKAAFGDDDD